MNKSPIDISEDGSRQIWNANLETSLDVANDRFWKSAGASLAGLMSEVECRDLRVEKFQVWMSDDGYVHAKAFPESGHLVSDYMDSDKYWSDAAGHYVETRMFFCTQCDAIAEDSHPDPECPMGIVQKIMES